MKRNRIVVKVGTSSLTYENGKLNLRSVEQLCKVLTDLQNSGKEIILVSSGAVAVGMGKVGIEKRPTSIKKKQALAAVGQLELMFIYDKLFGEYNSTVAQLLLTRRVVDDDHLRTNATNTFDALLDMGIIPIVNENDSTATDELEGENFGDNDMLSAIVANVVDADLLIILTDINGLYDSDPKENPNAKLISVVPKITEDIRNMAGGAGSKRGTGGMATKITAAQFATNSGIACCVMNGENPKRIYDLLEGNPVGTMFEVPTLT